MKQTIFEIWHIVKEDEHVRIERLMLSMFSSGKTELHKNVLYKYIQCCTNAGNLLGSSFLPIHSRQYKFTSFAYHLTQSVHFVF